MVAGPGEFAGKVIGQQDLAALLAASRNCGQRDARHHSPVDPVAGIPLICRRRCQSSILLRGHVAGPSRCRSIDELEEYDDVAARAAAKSPAMIIELGPSLKLRKLAR